VSREELRKRLWSSSTFANFEHGVTKGMNRLREVLEDSADQPRFIETLPQRGYRSIAHVEQLQNQGVALEGVGGRSQGADSKFVRPRGVRPERKSLITACWTFWAAGHVNEGHRDFCSSSCALHPPAALLSLPHQKSAL